MERIIITLAIFFLFLSCANEEVKKEEAETLETIEPDIEVTYNPESYSNSDRYCNELTKPIHVSFFVKFEEKGGVCGAECTYEIVATFDNGTEQTLLRDPFTLPPHGIRWHSWYRRFLNGCVSSRLKTYECKKTDC